MTAICFVCNLPILSHQVGLVWQGGNGWDDLVREQVEESTIRQRLGGRRDSATQIHNISPPSEIQETSPPATGSARRRRSSLAQLTDILREWSGGSSKRNKAPLYRRETLADLARSLPWGRQQTTDQTGTPSMLASIRKRRESSADSGIKSTSSKSRRDSHATVISDFRSEVAKLWSRRESTTVIVASTDRRRGSGESSRSGRRDSTQGRRDSTSRRGSGESGRSSRRDSTQLATPPPKIVAAHKKRRESRHMKDTPYYRQEQRPSTSSTASDSIPVIPASVTPAVIHTSSDSSTQALPPPTIIMSSVTPPATSPTVPTTQATTPTHPLIASRRDSTTQCGHRLNRRDSRTHASPDRSKLSRLQRQNTAYDESCLPPGVWGRRESQPTLSPDVDPDTGRKARRDSLSPDSASRGRRDSRSHLSPDRSTERDVSPVRRTRRGRLRRQSTSIAGRGPSQMRSPDSSSCSSRDPSPSNRPPPPPPEQHRPAIRRQSTTEEILIARGFRRQSTTEEMIRCRNFRRQSSQSDDSFRYKGRRDSCAQITDGTIGTMTVETTSTFFDSSTQTGKSIIKISL